MASSIVRGNTFLGAAESVADSLTFMANTLRDVMPGDASASASPTVSLGNNLLIRVALPTRADDQFYLQEPVNPPSEDTASRALAVNSPSPDTAGRALATMLVANQGRIAQRASKNDIIIGADGTTAFLTREKRSFWQNQLYGLTEGKFAPALWSTLTSHRMLNRSK